MENFKKKNLLQLIKMDLEEAKKYYEQLRRYNYENNNPIELIHFRRKIHKLLVNIIKLDRIINKQNLIILNNKSKYNDKPIIYASTHIGGPDVERVCESIGEHAYIFAGDPDQLYKDLSGLILYLNGVIFLHTNNKLDRKIGKERAIEVLSNKDNLLIYPEGAWNITDNLPVMTLYNGTVDIAKKANADIVPVAIEQYNNDYIVNIGKNIDISKISHLTQNEQSKILRDEMATLKWEIWENHGIMKREEINSEFIQKYNDNIDKNFHNAFGYTKEFALKTRFKDKNITEFDEAFAFMKDITPSKKNAFLYRKTK